MDRSRLRWSLDDHFFDETRYELLAAWQQTGVGERSCLVTELRGGDDLSPAGMSAGSALALWLTGLSRAAWRTYTHGGRFTEVDEVNTEAWRLAEDRRSFGEVPVVITEPGNASIESYSPLLWNAERAGHLLDQMRDKTVASADRLEVETELQAVSDSHREQMPRSDAVWGLASVRTIERPKLPHQDDREVVPFRTSFTSAGKYPAMWRHRWSDGRSVT